MERVAQPLRAMGAQIETHEGKPPVRIRGGAHLRAIDYTLPIASAQVKSALLLAALYAEGRSSVTEPAPTRDHTERMLRAFGVDLARAGACSSLDGGARLQACPIEVPGDFSSAAFFIVAGVLAAHEGLTLRGVGVNPTRTGLLDMLRHGGRYSRRALYRLLCRADGRYTRARERVIRHSRARGAGAARDR
jgi:3-phosphoshikimate 1-carboxyvinyltransferase